MNWLAAALLAMGISVGVTITDKYVVGHLSPRVYTFVVGLVGLLSLVFLPYGTGKPELWQWFFGMTIGVVLAYVVYTSFIAYQKDEISRFAPLTMLSTIMITIGAAIFFDEHLSMQQYGAFALFIIGAFLLATRLETLVLFEGKGSFRLDELPELALQTLADPIGEGIRTGKALIDSIDSTVRDWVDAARNPEITWIRFTRKLRLIKGLGWYLLSLALYIPYVLLAKELNGQVGVVNGWIAIRVGICIGGCMLMIGAWHELRQLRRKKYTIIATIKELFGMGTNYLILFASAGGVVAIVQSLWAVEAVGVFIVGTILARFGIIRESLARRDLIQKTIGVLFVVAATFLLFF